MERASAAKDSWTTAYIRPTSNDLYAPIVMNDLMTGILGDWEGREGKDVDLAVYDGVEPSPGSLLFDSKPAIASDAHSLFYQQRTLDFNGRQWLLVFDRTTPVSGIGYAPAWSTLTAGFALSGLLFWLILWAINTRANAVRIAGKPTEEIGHRQESLIQGEAFTLAILNSPADWSGFNGPAPIGE